MVYVLNKEGKAIMPTERHGKVRKLLRDGKAHVVKLMPFTIQLNYESKSYTQEVNLGIDAGSVHIGVSATTEKKELFAAEVVLRNDIVKKIANKLELRRSRRYRKTRYRKARFLNRKKCIDWLAPSICNKVDSHLKIIRLVYSILPISKTAIEVAQFDIQKIKNPNIQGVEYRQGEQMNSWNVREYILTRDNHTCQHCKGNSGDKILNVHHIESRKIGNNAPNNLITLCNTCHSAYHRGEFNLNLKRGIILRDAAVMNIMRWAIYKRAKEEFKNVYLTYGYITKYTRIKNNIKKSHCADAFCIAYNIRAIPLPYLYVIKMLRRHTRSLHTVTFRKKGIRRRATTTHWIGKTRLQKYDTVRWKSINCFIFGSTHNRPILRDIYGNLVLNKQYVNSRELQFISRNKNYLITIKTKI